MPGQYAVGAVTVTRGATTVTGTGTQWNTAPYTIPVGAMFSLQGSLLGLPVASVTSDTQLELLTPWTGSSRSGVNYLIDSDFTPALGLMLLGFKDVDPVTALNYNSVLLDNIVAGSRWAVNEIPTGSIPGSTFTCLHTPFDDDKVMVFINGQLLVRGVGYTISAGVITLTSALISGDYIRVAYQY